MASHYLLYVQRIVKDRNFVNLDQITKATKALILPEVQRVHGHNVEGHAQEAGQVQGARHHHDSQGQPHRGSHLQGRQ